MNRFVFSILLACLLCASCTKFSYTDNRTVPNGVWNSFEPQRFEFEWNKPDLCVDLSLTAAFDTSLYRDKVFPVIVKLKGPEGESRQFRSQISIVDRDGVLHGEANEAGQIVCRQVIRPHMFFNAKGKHIIELTQGTSKYDLVGVKQIGIAIEKSNLKYK